MKFFALCLFTLALWSGNTLAQSESDKAAVLETFESWNDGWANGDADLAVRDYAEDADWTNAFGDRFQGKQALRDGLEYIFSLGFVMTGESAGNAYADVRFLGPDVATVRSKLVRSGQKTSAGDVMPDRHIHHLRILERREGQWLIVSHLISQAKEKR
ncbi:MAG: SgcJ/EcaC family oxidoreductase [Pseudomonadota bacterium]